MLPGITGTLFSAFSLALSESSIVLVGQCGNSVIWRERRTERFLPATPPVQYPQSSEIRICQEQSEVSVSGLQWQLCHERDVAYKYQVSSHF
mmetsp:Transcript_26759/g.62171  ORF Transcript_26759/g.62171 Transcript_26759/m.62171 type:complete len:92 (-) Transcript_26759:19-294(-)